jgi:hypothetical protein
LVSGAPGFVHEGFFSFVERHLSGRSPNATFADGVVLVDFHVEDGSESSLERVFMFGDALGLRLGRSAVTRVDVEVAEYTTDALRALLPDGQNWPLRRQPVPSTSIVAQRGSAR